MQVRKRISASSASTLGYLLLLMTFAALGLFVAAFAAGSGLAAGLGIGLIGCLAGSVAGFRAASRRLTQCGVFAAATGPVSIFSTPLRQDQIDGYLESYRRQDCPVARTISELVNDDSMRRTNTEHAEPALLSA